jgi:hypothetical protein
VTNTTYISGENLIDTLSTSGVAAFGYAYDANKNRTAETVTGAWVARPGSAGSRSDRMAHTQAPTAGELAERGWPVRRAGRGATR